MKKLAGAAAAVAAVAVASAAAWWAGSGRSRLLPSGRPSLFPAACRGCNVLLITIDTLRSDRVGAYGGRGGLTPNLDRLAAEGFHLTRAYSAAPLTLPSHTSILTGVSPPIHGVRANGLFRLGSRLPTLATILKAAGYRTGAFVGAFVLDARFGLNRGFDEYDDRYGEKHPGDPTEGAERRAEEVIKPATAWIMSATDARPFFAWVHLYDPHAPYRAPEPYASRFPPYDAEVAYTDAMVGRMLDELRAGGRLDHTLVVVAADHGESLGEHDEPTHGVFTYDVTMRVPWIIWGGSRLRPGSSDTLARLIDLAPTTLDLAGIAAPPELEGRSIVPAATGRGQAAPFAYFEAMDANLTRNWAPLTGVVVSNAKLGNFKLIDLPIPELYDLAADPGETKNLFVEDPDEARTLGALLRDTSAAYASRSAVAGSGSGAERAALGAESRQRLQALGYVGSGADPGQRVYTDADDPKTMIGPSNDLNRAVELFNGGSRREAMEAVRRIIGAHPGFATAYGQLASMQRQSGDLRAAIGTLEEVVRRGIVDHRVVVELGGYLEEAGLHERAIDVLQAVIASHPDEVEAYNSLGAVYSATGRHDLARAAYHKVLEIDPTSAIAYENLGVDELRARERAAATKDLRHALELDPHLAAAHNTLATAYMLGGQSDAALEEWRAALENDPALYDALFNLGTALYQTGRRDEARPYLERFVNEAPPSRYAADIARLRDLLTR